MRAGVLESPVPHVGGPEAGGPRDEDRITPPTRVVTGEPHTGDRSVVVDPEQCIDCVGSTRHPPGPLRIGRFPHPRPGLLKAGPLQQ